MQSSDPQRFFETDAEQARRERQAAKASNKLGDPIVLKSKLVAAVADPSSSSSIFVAESAGSVRRVNVDDRDFKAVYRGPSAPVTCVAVGGPDNSLVFAGSWDKAVWSWHVASRSPGRKYVGHSDFVKAVVCTRIAGKDILVSGGADKKIIVWDVATGARLHVLQDPEVAMLGVLDLAVDPVRSTPDEVHIVSAGSDPHIRRWQVRLDAWEQVVDAGAASTATTPGAERRVIKEHETSVYRVVFDTDGEEVDLWTSSADGTSKCLSRAKGFTTEDSFDHGDHVRALVVTEQWVVTAGRDEDIKVWDRAAGTLYCSLQGHYDEVMGLVVLRGASGRGERLCSVSLDGTVRTWPLAKQGLDAAVQEQEEAAGGKKEEEEETVKAGGDMTAEEEAELAAMMEEDD